MGLVIGRCNLEDGMRGVPVGANNEHTDVPWKSDEVFFEQSQRPRYVDAEHAICAFGHLSEVTCVARIPKYRERLESMCHEDYFEVPNVLPRHFQTISAKLRVHPFGDEDTPTGQVSLWLDLASTGSAVRASVAVSILRGGADGSAVLTRSFAGAKLDAIGAPAVYGWAGFCERSQIEDDDTLAKDGTLHLHVTLKLCAPPSVESGIVGGSPDMSFKALPDHVARLKADFAGMLGQEDADLILVAEGKEHRAHKAILKARSPVLHAMLETDMKEKASGRIVIEDTDSVTVALLLHFIYTADLPPQVAEQTDAPELLGRLMKAADKYEVPNLVELCVAWMKRQLSITNLLKILEVAHEFGHEGLKRTCLEMATNGEDTLQTVQDSDDFEHMPPELVREMFVFAHGNNRRRRADALEFPAGTKWATLSRVQLQRACDERSLANCAGDREELARRLESWEAARPF